MWKRRKRLRHKQSGASYIPEPSRVTDDSEIGQGSGKKPDKDGVLQVLH